MSTNHSRVAVVAVPGVHLSSLDVVSNPVSFELQYTRISSGQSICIVVVIYRPGSAAVTSLFYDDLSDILDCVVGHNEQVYIVGDLNVRLDRPDDRDCQRLTDLFEVYGFVARVSESTHASGGLLDIVASRRDLPPPSVTVYDPGLSDHKHLQWLVPVLRPVVSDTTVVRRPWHQLDVITLSAAIRKSQLCRPDSWFNCSVDDLVSLYDSELTSICDALAPVSTVTCRHRILISMFDAVCLLTRQELFLTKLTCLS
jgi:hypothetical protein